MSWCRVSRFGRPPEVQEIFIGHAHGDVVVGHAPHLDIAITNSDHLITPAFIMVRRCLTAGLPSTL